MNYLRRVLILGAFGLTACSGLLHSTAPALQLYVLAPPETVAVSAAGSGPAAAAARTGPTLRVARPVCGPALNTDRIALLRPGNRLDYYAGSRWSAPLADLVSDLQLKALRDDSAWSAVADERSTFNADYLLQTSIERFTAQYEGETGAPTIRVDLHALLIRRGDGTLVGSFAVSEHGTASQNRMASVVAMFSAVADRALLDVATQSAQLLRSAKSPAPP